MELSAALLEKSEAFVIAVGFPSFKSILDESIFTAPVSSSQEASFLL